MKDNIRLLSLMLEDQKSADPIYRPGPYWERYQSRISSAIRKNGISDFRRDSAIGGSWADTLVRDPFDVSSNLKGAFIDRLMDAPFFRSIRQRYNRLASDHLAELLAYKSDLYSQIFSPAIDEALSKFEIPDTLLGNTEDVVQIGSKKYAAIYVEFIARMLNFAHEGYDFGDKKSVMEIGGGIGGMTHLFVSAYPNVRKFIYMDIPPILYVGTQYLASFFPDAVVSYDKTRSLKTIGFSDDDRLEILCLCPWQLPSISHDSVDVLYNSASFSEMTPEIVRNYAGFAKSILTDDAIVMLVMNKREPHPNIKISMPEEICNAFAPDFEFTEFEPKYELPVHPIYAGSRRTGHSDK